MFVIPRYDHRDGAFDWDYQMQLKAKPGGERVNYQEYKHWRETGVAFTWIETENTEPNLTFASGVASKGEKLVRHEYPRFIFLCVLNTLTNNHWVLSF